MIIEDKFYGSFKIEKLLEELIVKKFKDLNIYVKGEQLI